MANMAAKLALDAAEKHAKALGEIDSMLSKAAEGAEGGKVDLAAVQAAAAACSRAHKDFLTQIQVMKKMLT
jgi:hypothetical protein